MALQHKTIIKCQETSDGILAWDELKTKFEYDESKKLRLEHLEALAQTPYNRTDEGGMATYIDKFQAYIAELETIAPMDYSDFRIKECCFPISKMLKVYHIPFKNVEMMKTCPMLCVQLL